MEAAIKILLVDDHKLIREGIKLSLDHFDDILVVGEAATGEAALEALKTTRVDLVLMDISMEDMDGIEATQIIRKRYPGIKILALTMHDDESNIIHMLKAGAMGYLLKTTGMDDLLKAIKMVSAGEAYFSKKVSEVMTKRYMTAKTKRPDDFSINQLTKRELEILRLITAEYTNNEIAEKLFISPRTVETHRRNLIQKLHTNNTAGLVKIAIKNRVIEV